MRAKSAGLAASVWLMWSASAAAGPVADAAAKAEAWHAEGSTVEALGALNEAVDAVWRAGALAFRTVAIVDSADGFGLFAERADSSFRPDEELTVYVEPVAFGYGEGRVGFTADLALRNAAGQTLSETEDVFAISAPFAEGRRELFMTLTFAVPFVRPGDYTAVFTVHDQNSDKSGSFEARFSVALPVAASAQEESAQSTQEESAPPAEPVDDATLLAECRQAAADPASDAEIAAAIDACARANQRVPTDALTMHLLGNSYNAAERYAEAVDWYGKAAALGYAEAQNALGLKYDTGEGVPLDDVEAARLYRLAGEQGLAVAQYNLGLMYEYGEGVPADSAEAVSWYRLAAEQGRADAQNRLGLHYDSGDGVERNDGEAVRWYRLAAEQGLDAAQYNLGLMYSAGEGVPEDDAEAVRWHRLAAEQGYADAQNALGLHYDSGEGVALDDVEAARWYRLAADQGMAAAQHNIGLMYDNGEGVPQDEAEAVRWYRLSAEQGHANAQNRLALKYDSGSGVPLDDVEAARLYRAAADQGLAVAQYNLALMYDYGEGVSKSETEAVRWFQLAAEQGYADAHWELGVKYLNGAGGLPVDAATAASHLLAALKSQSSSAREALVDRQGADIPPPARVEIQRALSEAGAYSGAINGVFDAATVGALEAYAGGG